jgi:membrane associated rhomboid family serine protease
MFIPLKAETKNDKVPIVTLFLILINLLVFIYQIKLGENIESFVSAFGVVPSKIFKNPFAYSSYSFGNNLIRFPVALSLITSIFLHGNIYHFITNMLYLWVFGIHVEGKTGKIRFLLFFLICGVAAGATHIFISSTSNIPMVGASGAIAGIMGAFFLCYLGTWILTLFVVVPIKIPTLFFLGFWIINHLICIKFFPSENLDIAVWAHVGGFFAGVLLIYFFIPPTDKKKKKKK